MAVGGPLVISSNAATLKWRPFSSCFNLSQLLQGYIRLLSISYLSAYNISAWLWPSSHVRTDSPPFPSHECEHMQHSHSANTCMKRQKMPETETLGGNDMHCLFNHVLWDDSVIMLSSARFGAAKLALLSAHNSTLQVLTAFFSLPVFHLHSFISIANTTVQRLQLWLFWSSHIKPVWQALCVNS